MGMCEAASATSRQDRFLKDLHLHVATVRCRFTMAMRREKLMDEDDGPGTFANFLEIAAFMGLLLTVATGVLMVVYTYL